MYFKAVFFVSQFSLPGSDQEECSHFIKTTTFLHHGFLLPLRSLTRLAPRILLGVWLCETDTVPHAALHSGIMVLGPHHVLAPMFSGQVSAHSPCQICPVTDTRPKLAQVAEDEALGGLRLEWGQPKQSSLLFQMRLGHSPVYEGRTWPFVAQEPRDALDWAARKKS